MEWAKGSQGIYTRFVGLRDKVKLKTCTTSELRLHASTRSRDSGARHSRVTFGKKFKYLGRVNLEAPPTTFPSQSMGRVFVVAWVNLTECKMNGFKNLPTKIGTGAGPGGQASVRYSDRRSQRAWAYEIQGGTISERISSHTIKIKKCYLQPLETLKCLCDQLCQWQSICTAEKKRNGREYSEYNEGFVESQRTKAYACS